jgi:hypothetical protein
MDTPRMDYKQILKTWAERHQITPAELHRITHYSYQHVWDLLRGNGEVTEGTIGRILASVPSDLGQDLYQAISGSNVTC